MPRDDGIFNIAIPLILTREAICGINFEPGISSEHQQMQLTVESDWKMDCRRLQTDSSTVLHD
jgi:hypothetical protein